MGGGGASSDYLGGCPPQVRAKSCCVIVCTQTKLKLNTIIISSISVLESDDRHTQRP